MIDISGESGQFKWLRCWGMKRKNNTKLTWWKIDGL